MKPLVSIGFPVYNGEAYIKEAFDSIIRQSYENIEIIVSDNASTDQTWEICQGYLAQDNRVRCYRNNENLGIVKNFERTLELANGKYFMWMADDDICHPEYVAEMVAELEADPQMMLCASDVRVIDEDGNFLYEINMNRIHLATDWMRARRDFFKYPQTNSFMTIYGLFQTQMLKQIGVAKSVWRGQSLGGEPPLLAKIALIGRIASIPRHLKTARIDHQSLSNIESKSNNLFDYWARTIIVRMILTKIVLESSLPLLERMDVLAVTIWYNLKLVGWLLPRYTLGTLRRRYLVHKRNPQTSVHANG